MSRSPKIVYIDLDDTLCDLQTALGEAKKRNPAMPFPQAEYGFYVNLAPIEGGLAVVSKLVASDQYDPWILTAPSVRNPFSYAEKRVWVENHLGMKMVERLIISPNKGLLRGDYLIDDNVSGKGQEAFKGTLIHFGSQQFSSWKEIDKFFFE